MAIRGSVNRGFRAPSLQQIYNGQTTSNAQNGQIRQTKQLPADDVRLDLLGIPFPGPELSWNYNLGFTARSGSSFLFTIDAYAVNVRNRIIISEVLPVSAAIPFLLDVFPATSGIKEVTFFTNHINTRTTGVDVVTTWKHQFSNSRKIQTSLALTLNSTSITGRKAPPERLTSGATMPVKLIDTISESLITMALPQQKVITNVEYATKRFQLFLRITYFGKVTAWEKPPGLWHRSQVFKGKAVCDLSAGYALSRRWKISIGVNNLFNIYPDRVDKSYASYTSGQVPYTRGALQFGFNGAFYFTSMQLQF
jgi:iron complex outermembrane receptor protein